ncbi:MAG: TM2 domain-containing protein [Flavobacteriia bacterium]|nr:TM2 domain-containing protein [Flavobacteriia bacterium]
MNRVLNEIPEASGQELFFLERLLETCDSDQLSQFSRSYRSRRKSPQLMLVFCVIGMFALPGIQRLFVGQIGMFLLYLFTAGIFLIGSIIDLFNYEDLAFKHNQAIAKDIIQHV